MDCFSKEVRSSIMARIRSKDTKPEKTVRSLLHSMGYRFRLHRKGLPGRPDVVLPKYNTVVFVHGCFWHMHGCKRSNIPKSNTDYWLKKLERNVQRDAERTQQLEGDGWNVIVVWECDLKDLDSLAQRLVAEIIPR